MEQARESERLLTVKEAADVLRVSPHTLLRWVKLDKMEVVRFSRKIIRFDRDELTRWIRLHTSYYGGT